VAVAIIPEILEKGENMDEVAKLIEQADVLFEKAEMMVEETPEEGRQLFLEGISLLLRGFLTAGAMETDGGLNELLARCKQAEPEFETVETEFELLQNAAADDGERITDAANEIWDFVIDLVTVAE
jgi:hypothetical protein